MEIRGRDPRGRQTRGTLNPRWGIAFLMAVFIHTQACTPLLVVGSAVGFGVTYYSGNVAERTFTYELTKVWEATLGALDEMAITVVDKNQGESAWEIQARTDELGIEIAFDAVTPSTTKVKVNAARKSILRDMATATEIVAQINNQLVREEAKRPGQKSKGKVAGLNGNGRNQSTDGASTNATSSKETSGPARKFVEIRVDSANIRAEGTTASQVLVTLPRGMKLEKLAETPDWVKVRLASGVEGFIARRLVQEIDGVPQAAAGIAGATSPQTPSSPVAPNPVHAAEYAGSR